MKMEYAFEVLRGWPQDGALDRIEPIKTGDTLKNGDVVTKHTDGTVTLVGATASNKVGVVIQGNGDSASASGVGKALVLWGNYIARVASTAYAAGAYAPGSNVTGKSGKFALDAGSDPVVGVVLDVIPASATETESLVILVR